MDTTIEQIAAVMDSRVTDLTNQIQHMLATEDLSNPATLTKIQFFAQQLSTYSELNSTMLKVYRDVGRSIISHIP